MPDGEYDLGGQAVVVADRVARLARDGSIAGSTLTMDAALRQAVGAGRVHGGRRAAMAVDHAGPGARAWPTRSARSSPACAPTWWCSTTTCRSSA